MAEALGTICSLEWLGGRQGTKHLEWVLKQHFHHKVSTFLGTATHRNKHLKVLGRSLSNSVLPHKAKGSACFLATRV